MSRIGIIGAMEEELETLLATMQSKTSFHRSGSECVRFSLGSDRNRISAAARPQDAAGLLKLSLNIGDDWFIISKKE